MFGQSYYESTNLLLPRIRALLGRYDCNVTVSPSGFLVAWVPNGDGSIGNVLDEDILNGFFRADDYSGMENYVIDFALDLTRFQPRPWHQTF